MLNPTIENRKIKNRKESDIIMPRTKKSSSRKTSIKKSTRKSSRTTRKRAGNIDEKKLEFYANKLYRGELSRYKKKLSQNRMYSLATFYIEEKKIKRIKPSTAQEKRVRDIYGNKCAICNKPYDKDDFEYHHINGDRSKTVVSNLVLLCHRCHKKVTTLANAKLRDYKVKLARKTEKSKTIFDQVYKPPRINWY